MELRVLKTFPFGGRASLSTLQPYQRCHNGCLEGPADANLSSFPPADTNNKCYIVMDPRCFDSRLMDFQ